LFFSGDEWSRGARQREREKESEEVVGFFLNERGEKKK
jgi:hypothetical protein